MLTSQAANHRSQSHEEEGNTSHILFSNRQLEM